jgi:SAM-dependent methyltransferase
MRCERKEITQMNVRALRTQIFSSHWPLDLEITNLALTVPSHSFLSNPAGQYPYLYLMRFVKVLSEQHLKASFSDISVLDWGCGKGHVSKLLRDLGATLESCDILSDKSDSAFGQATPILEKFKINVKPLEHRYILPYADRSFDVILSVGVLEHVADDRASLQEITRVLKPGGLFFCFFLPTDLSWTQKLARLHGYLYHDRLYSPPLIKRMLEAAGLDLLDIWYRQLLPKNSIRYPGFRFFEHLDQFLTEHTPLRIFATNIEFVSQKAHLP